MIQRRETRLESPDADMVLEPGDVVVLLGAGRQLDAAKAFKDKYGMDALAVDAADPMWEPLRAEIMTAFVREVRRLLDEAGHELVVVLGRRPPVRLAGADELAQRLRLRRAGLALLLLSAARHKLRDVDAFQRTLEEYRRLLAESGLVLTRVLPTDTAFSVIEARPAA